MKKHLIFSISKPLNAEGIIANPLEYLGNFNAN